MRRSRYLERVLNDRRTRLRRPASGRPAVRYVIDGTDPSGGTGLGVPKPAATGPSRPGRNAATPATRPSPSPPLAAGPTTSPHPST